MADRNVPPPAVQSIPHSRRDAIGRRGFLKAVGAGAGAAIGAAGATTAAREASARASAVHARQSPDVVVVGAGAFGTWTALHLQRLGAGVVRARRAIESVARVFEDEGGAIRVDRAAFGARTGRRLANVRLASGDTLSADTIIFACGPWFPKVLPDLMGRRIRISMGHVFYFAVPPGDTRFTYPFMPSYGVPGCTGWPALPPDHRGFRVRTGSRPPDDPDTSDRWIAPEYHERPRAILTRHFPDLAGAPINETRACHYESSVDSNFIIDVHPELDNVWLAGGGSGEAFKFGPVLGDYIAHSVLGNDREPELADGFRLKDDEFESA